MAIIFLALILLLPSYSQESSSTRGTGYVLGGLMLDTPLILIREPNINGDTIKLSLDEAYGIFSGMLQKKNIKIGSVEFFVDIIKIKSVIYGKMDTTNYNFIRLGYLEKHCPDKKIKINKDYLVSGFFAQSDFPDTPSAICDEIFPDTPENREMLIKKYEKMVIIPTESTGGKVYMLGGPMPGSN